MSPFTAQLMLESAARRRADAERLDGKMGSGDSGYLLNLLALEVLLKCLVRLNGGAPKRNHFFHEHFNLLPQGVQESVVRRAIDRMSTSANYTDVPRLLKEYSRNFITLRYPYEEYEGLNEEQYRQLGRDWVAKGLPEEEATFRYFPMELFGFLDAFDQEVKHLLANQPAHPTPSAAEPPRRV